MATAGSRLRCVEAGGDANHFGHTWIARLTMRAFFETTFGPNELEVLESALTQWRQTHCVNKDDPESELAAAIMITLFREGYRSLPDLLDAAGKHKGLRDLTAPSREL